MVGVDVGDEGVERLWGVGEWTGLGEALGADAASEVEERTASLGGGGSWEEERRRETGEYSWWHWEGGVVAGRRCEWVDGGEKR